MNKKLKKYLSYILFLALFLRIIVLIFASPYFPLLLDDAHLEQVGVWALNNQNPYLESFQEGTRVSFNHMPGWIVYTAAIKFVSNITDISWNILYRIPFMLADLFMNFMLFITILRLRRSKTEAKIVSFLYAINPVTIGSAIFLAQPSIVIILFVFMSWYFLHFSKGKRWILSAVMFSLSPIWKLVSIISLPVILLKFKSWKKWFFFSLISGSISVLLLVPFVFYSKESLPMIIKHVFGYFGSGQPWGLGLVLNTLNHLTNINFFNSILLSLETFSTLISVGTLLLTIYIVYKKNYSLLISIYSVFLVFMVFKLNLALQHLAWIVPFVLLVERKNVFLLISLSFSMIFGLLFFAFQGGQIPIFGLSSLVFLFSILAKLFFLTSWIFIFKSWLRIIARKKNISN